MANIITTDELDEIIVGRIKPSIYAFSTNTVPNYLKVGDTYRPVATRLAEWKKYFPDLIKEFEDTAAVSDDVFFRDYAIHQYLEFVMHKHRLQRADLPYSIYYSNEFFKETTSEDVSKAIKDIRIDFAGNTGRYQFYDAGTRMPETYTYASTGLWQPRPNQQRTIENFKKAVLAGRKNLLMYAVMRFGKSFTSLCCAKEMGAKLVLVVSAKADVREEWKRTTESADNFNQEYTFLSSGDLTRDRNAIKNGLDAGRGVVVFLTLQDLQGDTIKEKHKEVFENTIDLLIVDETHYGARAESYGRILRDANYKRDVKDSHADEDFVELRDAQEVLKNITVNVTLHLSGTPYRILMGSEFEKEDIIAFYQFTDIVRDQKQWDDENLLKDGVKEWDNPYYGFPQMVRFAFSPSKSALELLDSLKNSGTSYAFSALLQPESIEKDVKNLRHKKFVHEREVLELFQAIDGSRTDEGVLAFLDYDKIREGKLCRHMVVVLPYCASCDALEELLKNHASEFKNLQEYEIINISGVEKPNEYKDVQAVRGKIKQCEAEGRKTLTLTVNRMLTGSTVEQWDTMIYLKDTSSPQEYDQAIFRLQNQYIKEYTASSGDTIRYNMKPQTLLVDFDPHRMFTMQEQKSMVYNVNTDVAGNQYLRERIDEELKISPIILVNKNGMSQVEANDILKEISQYSRSRGVLEETKDIPIDLSLLGIEDIKTAIEQQAELGSRGGLSMDAYSGDSTDYDDGEGSDESGSEEAGSGDSGQDGKDSDTENTGDSDSSTGQDPEKEKKSLENRFRTYYSRILFYAFLTGDTVASLDDILDGIHTDDNARIAFHMGLSENVLFLIKNHMNLFVLRQLDYKIQNINELARDETVDAIQRARTAIKKFGRISDSEVTTPEEVADDIVSLIPEDCFLNPGNIRILDIAGKMGEFAIAIVKRCAALGVPLDSMKDKIMSIPTSSVAYEFTRKVYEVLGLDVHMIATRFTSYDLLDVKETDEDGMPTEQVDYEAVRRILSQPCPADEMILTDNITEEGELMRFNAIVGNPPFQESDGGAGASARALYPDFVNMARKATSHYSSLIIPARWFTGGKHLDDFRRSMLNDTHIRELHDCQHPEEIFPDTNNRGGICYFLWDSEYDNESSGLTKVVTHNGNGEKTECIRSLKVRDLNIFIRDAGAISILDKVIPDSTAEAMNCYISARKPFGIGSNIVKSFEWYNSPDELMNPVECYGKGRKLGYIAKEKITSNKELIGKWKVFTPRANNVGTELKDDNLNTFVGLPNQVCTEAYIVLGCGLDLDRTSAEHLAGYFNTKFVRYMHSLAKTSHDASRSTYRFVPVVDFNEEWTDEKLYRKYNLTEKEIDLIERSIKPMG